MEGKALHHCADCRGLPRRAARVLPAGRRAPQPGFNLAGAALLVAGLVLTLLALTRLQQGALAAAAALLGVGVGVLAVFLRVERRTAQSLVDLDLFRRRAFTAGLLATFLNFIAMASNDAKLQAARALGIRGTYQAGMVVALGFYGVSKEVALAIAVLVEVVSHGAAMALGLVCLWLEGVTLDELRTLRARYRASSQRLGSHAQGEKRRHR